MGSYSRKSNTYLQYFALGTKALFIVLFGAFGTERPKADGHGDANDAHHQKVSFHTANSYASFQDVHVMIYRIACC